MKIIWQLFGIHIVLLSTILLLFLAWLVWPRRFKNWRKNLLRLNGLTIFASLLLAIYIYWPRVYEKKYIDTPVTAKMEQTPLKVLADSIDFFIGVATSANSLNQEKIASEFNSVVAENDFKPNQLLTDPANWEFDFSKADKLVSYTSSNDLRLRGHTLIWGKFPGRTFPSQWMEQVNTAENKPKQMEQIITKYIGSVMGHFKGKIPTWDVVNEPMDGDKLYSCLFTETLGEKYIDLAFKVAHRIDPNCALYLNEAIIDYEGAQGKAFLALLERLLNRGVPIDGVGLQTHHLFDIHNATELKKYIQAIQKLGLDVEITELDVRLLLFGNAPDPYQAQGEQYKKIVEICLNAPNCKGVTFWGLTDKDNWMDAIPPFNWKSPNAPNIFDEEMRRKPAYKEVWRVLNDAE